MTYPFGRIELPAGAILFTEGDLGESAYLIQSGEIETFASRGGAETTIAKLGPGEIAGEFAIIAPGPRTISARAVADSVLLVITKAQIDRRIANADPILRLCLGYVADRYALAAAGFAHRDGLPNKTGTSPPVFNAAVETLSLEADLRRAMKAGELVPYFQPIIRFGEQRLVGFEALARWRHPGRGLLLPDEFIPIAEASGLIVDITSWCLAQAAIALPQMMDAALHNVGSTEPLFLSINVAGDDLVETPFASRVADMLAASGVSAESLKIEVTESTLMKDPDKAAESLQACRSLGVLAAIDDFGTGYSSLSYLTKLPISEIKIAPSFVRSMAADPTTEKIIKMVLGLAQELDLPVIAEGIEETVEAVALMEMGCAFGQGYLFGRPAPLDQTLHLIRYWRSSPRIAPQKRMASRGSGALSPLGARAPGRGP
jgi:diguanylate cyclase